MPSSSSTSAARPDVPQPARQVTHKLRDASVLYVNSFPGEHVGGGEVHLLHLIRAAVGAGMRVAAVTASSSLAEAIRDQGGAVVEDDLKTRVPSAVCRLVRYVRRSQAAIVQGTSPYTNLLARLAATVTGAYAIDTFHTQPASTLAFRSDAKALLSQKLRDSADAATRRLSTVSIAVSDAVRRDYLDRGANPSQVVVVHNGVDIAALTASTHASGEPVDAALYGPGPSIGSVGRLEPVKGFDVLLAAVPAVLAAHPDAQFLIAGDGPERKHLADLRGTSPTCADHVHLLGFVEPIASFLGHLDVYCLPSRSEGFNITILEAMALGIPVVATDVGGTAEAVNDGSTGILVPPERPDLLAAALDRMLSRPDIRREMGRNARRVAEERFEVTAMQEALLEVYHRVLTGEIRQRQRFRLR